MGRWHTVAAAVHRMNCIPVIPAALDAINLVWVHKGLGSSCCKPCSSSAAQTLYTWTPCACLHPRSEPLLEP